MPLSYQGIRSEHAAVRQRAGLFDVSHMGQLELRGDQAADVANELITNDLSRIRPGRALYTCCCRDDGGVLDDLIVYLWSPSRVHIVCNASNRSKLVPYFTGATEHRCEFRDLSGEIAMLALQGPQAMAILARARGSAASVGQPPAPFQFDRFRVAQVDCTVARTGYTGEDGVELFCAAGDAPALFSALVTTGQPLGLEPVGLGARDTLRLEARLPLYGNEIDETTNPLEAGLGWTVKLGKERFVGRAALEQVKRAGLTRKLVGFEMVGRGIARHGYPLLGRDGEPVGRCTSGAPAPTLGKNIGLGYLPVQLSAIDTKFRVDCRGKPIEAVVVKTPFYSRRSRI